MQRWFLRCALAAAPILASRSAQAWIYDEHRAIAATAWSELRRDARASLEHLWEEARVGYGTALCTEALSGARPSSTCIDFAALPAISGDHSCSPKELITKTIPSVWIHDVAEVSADVAEKLRNAQTEEDRLNVWNGSNLRLQAVDDGYVTRAGANNAHFLLPLHDEELDAFVRKSAKAGAPLNALGLYVDYHSAATALARSASPVDRDKKAERARRILALEAYALHFLEDVYSSGHVAGTWGDAATRKGTHDYYSVNGYTDVTWSGKKMTMFGDAHMKSADLRRSANAAARSLELLYEALREGESNEPPADASFADAAYELDSCEALVHPPPPVLAPDDERRQHDLLMETPVPGHGPELAPWPRFRADFGPFIGLTANGALGPVFGGYGGRSTRGLGKLAVAARLGYGLEGVVGYGNSGTMFLQAGVVMHTAQHDTCASSTCDFEAFGSSAIPRVPARVGLDLGLRLPFWLVPGDLLLLGPALALISPSTLTRVGIQAAGGGLLPWQRTFATPVGQFEAVVGRQVGVELYGIVGGRTLGWASRTLSDGQSVVFQTVFRSATFTFPIVEYTPLRTVAQKLTASVRTDLSYAVDIPFDEEFWQQSGISGPRLPAAHMGLIRLSVEGRDYL